MCAQVWRLSADTARQLRSTSMITSICDIVLELLNNSIDACASKILVKVSVESYMVEVMDNGHGIKYKDFSTVGRRSSTSKQFQSEYEISRDATAIGYRGEASISSVGLVRITSKHVKSRDIYQCFIKDERQTAAEKCKCLPTGFNTIVSVSDIFAAYPVRRNVIRESAKKIIDSIKIQLQARSLYCPSISLKFVKGADSEVVFSYASATTLNRRIAQVYGTEIARELGSVSLEYGEYILEGSISKVPTIQRIQHIFCNKQMYDSVELINIARQVLDTREYMSRANNSELTGASTRALRAQHPMFILRLTDAKRASREDIFDKMAGKSLVIQPEMRKTVAIACVKFLRKFGMISDLQMQHAVALADKSSSSTLKRPLSHLLDSPDSYLDAGKVCGRETKSVQQIQRSSAVQMVPVNSRFPIRLSQQGSNARAGSKSAAAYKRRESETSSYLPVPCARLADIFLSHGNPSASASVPIGSLQVIGQADEKFIICQANEWLFAIDQHAADERIRLEAQFDSLSHMLLLLGQLPPRYPAATVDGVTMFVPPICVTLASHEVAMVRDKTGELRMLGIEVVLLEANNACQEQCKARIICAPSVLAPRLRSSRHRVEEFGKELLVAILNWLQYRHVEANVLQKSAAGLMTDLCGLDDSEPGIDQARGWPALVNVPDIILDTVRSISCRGALKFNEHISIEESKSIVRRLSECKYPEFCAHGRDGGIFVGDPSPGFARSNDNMTEETSIASAYSGAQ
ncbi:DNA mismatch repair protein [Coemansia umbellata]|uniref:DNA mismatch repair protein n=1 Tax=Coemansia umbellata TaxID=1424467 RepID=A0ABQ8PJ65_9FUNG|nr:DNA mismatch repair protein [Coemansia umbellata]